MSTTHRNWFFTCSASLLAAVAMIAARDRLVHAQGQRPPASVAGIAAGPAAQSPDPLVPLSWSAGLAYPQTICRYAFAQVGEDVYVIGGVSNGTRQTTVRKYSPAANTWTLLAPIPVASEAPSAAYYAGKIYVAEGDTGNSLRIYDIATNTWSAGASRPGVSNNYGTAAGASSGKVYVVGSGTTTTTLVSVYDIATNTWNTGPASPVAVLFPGYVQAGKYLYVIGGFESGLTTNSTASMRLDMDAGSWTVGPTFTPQRADFALAVAGSKLYAIGGDTTGGAYFDSSLSVNQLDISAWPSGTWTAYSDNLPTVRQANSAGFTTTGRVGGEIWSTGGLQGATFTFLAEHVYNAVVLPTSCGAWTVKAPYPLDVYGAGATSAGNAVYVAGGYSVSVGGETAAFRRYNVIDNNWTTLANLPDTSTTMPSSVYSPINNKVYVFGGEVAGTGTVTAVTRIYDIGSNTWSTGAPMPGVRAFAASGYLNGKIYIVGGYSTGQVTSAQTQVWEYDALANTWNTSKAPIPHGVGGAGFGIINGHLLVAGGRDATAATIALVYDYDIAANSWTARASLPIPMNVPGSAVVNGRLWLFGGGNPFGPGTTPAEGDAPFTAATTFKYDPPLNFWSSGPALAGARSFVAGAAAGSALLAVGGYNGSTSVTTTEMSRCAGLMDFDIDGRTDRTIFRPSSGTWYSALSNGGATAVNWGTNGDIDVLGDYDGDDRPDRAVFRPSIGTWYIVRSGTGTVQSLVWGTNGDIPMAADIDGDGLDDPTIYRPSTGAWYVAKSSGGTASFSWGISTDQPVIGDYDGDGKADITVFRGSSGVWYILKSSGGFAVLGWGTNGDIPVSGDFDGDDISDLAIFRQSTGQWWVNKTTVGTLVVPWGTSGDTPVSGDMDGDGRADFNIYRNGAWYSQLSAGGTAVVVWGTAGDKPIGRVPGS
jgi:N-acetylneuraminic acid mutarotase